MHFLGLLGMYFDAVVVKVTTFLLLFRLALAILCYVMPSPISMLWYNPLFCCPSEATKPLFKISCLRAVVVPVCKTVTIAY